MTDTTPFREGDQTPAVNARMVAGMRFVLSISALAVIFIDPTEPDRLVSATYAALIAYSLYSLVLLVYVFNDKSQKFPSFYNPYWLDVGWYLLFITLSSGTGSIFFFFFYFAILNASFLKGLLTGLKVTVVSAAGFTILGYLLAPGADEFELGRFLIRPLSLLMLGYMISFWGGKQTTTLRRLNLLRDIGIRSNPRFGAERTIATNLELLREFYRADSCIMITKEGDPDEYVLRRAEASSDGSAVVTRPLDERFAGQMLSLSPKCAAIFETRHATSFLNPERLHLYDCEAKAFVRSDELPFVTLAEQLDARAFMTAPANYRGVSVGRLFVVSASSNPFEPSDITFLMQVIDHFFPIVENIRLVDRLASDAADEERKKIARDIHDSIIQPYIGLQMGIDSVIQAIDENKAGSMPGTPSKAFMRSRLDRLRDLTEKGISDLREYVSGLSETRSTGAALLPSIRRYSEKFTFATGIRVDIDCADGIHISDRLAGELFQIVAEALSNVHRHTQSPWANVDVAIKGNSIELIVSNAAAGGDELTFNPRSITERATALGGSVNIDNGNGRSAVKVGIPL